MFVKICGVTTVEDALLAAGMGADAVGINFAAVSPRRVSVGRGTEMVKRLPPEVLTVGIFRDELRDRVVEIANTVGLQAVQLHGRETAQDARWVAERVPAMIRAFSIDDPALVSGDDHGADRLLIDSPLPGSGESFDWTLLDRVAAGRPYILAGGLNPTNVADAIAKLSPWGVDVASGVEVSPGRKDPAKVRKFIQTARRAAEDTARRAAEDTARRAAEEDTARSGVRFDAERADGLHPDESPVASAPERRVARPYDWGAET